MVETRGPGSRPGRLLAELGEHKQADAAFARASALGKGSLYPFLEAGWWVAGPYPPALELSCPPEFDPDPSKPIAAVNEPRDLKWQSVSFAADTASIGMESAFAGRQDVSLYALTYVYAQQDRSAALILSTGEGPVRLWVNGRLAFEGYACWGAAADSEAHIPIALKAGRNTLLIQTQHVGSFWCHCRFDDDPTQKAMNLLHLGLWSEAADALAEADRRVPLDAMTFRFRVHALFAAGRDDEARQAFAEMVRRYARPDSEDVNVELAPRVRAARREGRPGAAVDRCTLQDWPSGIPVTGLGSCSRTASTAEDTMPMRRPTSARPSSSRMRPITGRSWPRSSIEPARRRRRTGSCRRRSGSKPTACGRPWRRRRISRPDTGRRGYGIG